MALLSLKFLKKTSGGRLFSPHSPGEYLFWSSILLLAIFCGLLAYDGYLFFSVTNTPNESVDKSKSVVRVAEGSIDEIIMLLDEREKKFNEILHTN
jgi:hypothetical protein